MKQQLTLQLEGENTLVLRGVMESDTVLTVLATGIEYIREKVDIRVDLQYVTHANSSGIALLLEWWRCAKKLNKSIQFLNIPAQLSAVIDLGDLENILPVAQSN